jgi:hypothetical protein
MIRPAFVLILLAIAPQQSALRSSRTGSGTVAAEDRPVYTANSELKMPERYREWIFLTSGVDMSYTPNGATAGHSMFDNVFVNPSSYRAFLETGTWPDKTTLVLEEHGAEAANSINRRGHTQSQEVMGMEVHVKDAKLEGAGDSSNFTDRAPRRWSIGRPTATSATRATLPSTLPLFSSTRRCSAWRSQRVP